MTRPYFTSLTPFNYGDTLDLLKIDNGTPLEVSTDGNVLIVTPVRDEERVAKFKEALESTNHKYGRALKRLAG